jgi:hypothetical protein
MDAPDRAIAELAALLPRVTTEARRWAEPRLAAARERLARGQAVDRTVAELAPRLAAAALEVERRGKLALTIAYPDLPVSAARAGA